MKTAMQQVAEFHTQIVGRPPAPTPSILMDADRIRLRLRLILEEVGELAEALGSDGTTTNVIEHVISMLDADTFTAAASLVETADALGDITYVTVGAALEMGIPLAETVTEIHASNMTKSPSEKRGDGKVMKGARYRPPNIKAVLDAARNGEMSVNAPSAFLTRRSSRLNPARARRGTPTVSRGICSRCAPSSARLGRRMRRCTRPVRSYWRASGCHQMPR